MTTNSLLRKVAATRGSVPAMRRAILDLILERPDRVLEQSIDAGTHPLQSRDGGGAKHG